MCLKLSSKATKLGSLFPKVNTDLSVKTACRFQVRVEIGCRSCVETHAIYAYGVCLMQLDTNETTTISTGVKAWKYTSGVVLKPPTSSLTRRLQDSEATEARMLLLEGATFCFIGLMFQSIPTENMRPQKARARLNTMHVHMRGSDQLYVAALPR